MLAAQDELERVLTLSLEDALLAEGHTFEVKGIPGEATRGEVKVSAGPFPDTQRVQVSLRWKASDGHWRDLELLAYRARHDLTGQLDLPQKER